MKNNKFNKIFFLSNFSLLIFDFNQLNKKLNYEFKIKQ